MSTFPPPAFVPNLTTALYRGFSMGWCRGGVMEGNQAWNVDIGGPYPHVDSRSARDIIVRNNFYRNVGRGPYFKLGGLGSNLGSGTIPSISGNEVTISGTSLTGLAVGDRVKIVSSPTTFSGVYVITSIQTSPSNSFKVITPNPPTPPFPSISSVNKVFGLSRVVIEGNVIELANSVNGKAIAAEDANNSSPYDIALLEKALQTEPDNPRYVYYLAQSYRDCQQYERAMEWYQKRAILGGWEEEAWHAAYQVGKMQAQLHRDWRMVLYTFLQAYSFRPSRLEPVYHIANFYREQQQYALAHLFARLVREVPYPQDILFVERDVYEFLLPLEYAMSCQGLGRQADAADAYKQILALPTLPDRWRDLAMTRLASCETARHAG